MPRTKKTNKKRGADHHWHKAEEDKVGPYVPTGKPRGRTKDPLSKGPYVKTGKPRGNPNVAKKVRKPIKRGAAHHWYKAEEDKVAPKPYVPTGKPRGRPKNPDSKPYVPSGKPRGRPKASE